MDNISEFEVTLKIKPGNSDISREVRFHVAKMMVVVRNMVEDVGLLDEAIPLPNVDADVFDIILEYCERHKDEETTSVGNLEIDPWDREFITRHKDKLFRIILAANYLDIKPLLDMGCKYVANCIRGKSTEQVRVLFSIPNDWSPEETQQINIENGWGNEGN